MVMPVASGYPDYSPTLIAPILSDAILDRFRCTSPFMDLTTGSFLDPLTRCGDTIRFKRDTPAMVRPLIKNQKLEDDFLEDDCVYIRAGTGLYYSLKIDELDMKQICNSQELINRYINDAVRQFRYGMEIDCFSKMVCGADYYNQGSCAGLQTQGYDLGTATKPLIINKDNILDWIADLYSVHMEACTVSPGMSYEIEGPLNQGAPFLTLPIEGYNVLKRALSGGNCCYPADQTPMITGQLPSQIHGFTLFVSGNLPYSRPDSKTRVYMLPSGSRDATGFVTTAQADRQVTEACSWGHRFQGYMVWACGVLYPEALAMSRVVFER